MCTITLSYNENDKAAIEKLVALLDTGLFVQLGSHDALGFDHSDPSLYEVATDLPEIDRDLTPEELEKMITDDIHSIYEVAYAI